MAYIVVHSDAVGLMPRKWVIDEGAGHRLIAAGLSGGLHGFSRELTGDTDCTAAIVEDFAPFAIVRAHEAEGCRASFWTSWDHAYRCAKEAHGRGMLVVTDRRYPGAAWAVVDTRFDAERP
jgi:hypothetical protein